MILALLWHSNMELLLLMIMHSCLPKLCILICHLSTSLFARIIHSYLPKYYILNCHFICIVNCRSHGVSADDIQRLNSFSSDSNYCAGKFPVASDPGGQIAATYGLTISAPKAGIKDVRGQDLTHGFIPRTTFVIGKDGKIIAVFSSATDHISPVDHVEKSLAIVKGL